MSNKYTYNAVIEYKYADGHVEIKYDGFNNGEEYKDLSFRLNGCYKNRKDISAKIVGIRRADEC